MTSGGLCLVCVHVPPSTVLGSDLINGVVQADLDQCFLSLRLLVYSLLAAIVCLLVNVEQS